MAQDPPSEELSSEVGEALKGFVDEGCPEEVNSYLDKAGMSHPQLHHEPRQSMPTHEQIQELVCDRGFKSMHRWVLDKRGGGHFIWWCAPE